MLFLRDYLTSKIQFFEFSYNIKGDDMNLIIGVLGRTKIVNREITTFSKALTDAIISFDHIPLGIIAPVIDINQEMTSSSIEKLHQTIDLCDGVILQGGSDYYQYDLEAIKYIVDKNIPLLGICLGMQSMGVVFGSSLIEVEDHNHIGMNYAHPINIDEKSQLYQIVGLNQIVVNSRHKETITNPTKANTVAYNADVIEAIEKSDKAFCIGVQWHPEDMLMYDETSRKIFASFFNSCKSERIKK